jgi:CheY-like chemotaxis protein
MADNNGKRFSSRFKLFHELMPTKVQHILLISTSYEAWIMEEDGRLSEQIVNEYRGLNLSRPPRLTWASSLDEAIGLLVERPFDFVVTFAQTVDDKAQQTGTAIKRVKPGIPVVLLTYQETIAESSLIGRQEVPDIDRIFFWTGQADILLAIIKCIEDEINAVPDTTTAGVRVILFVEDSPYYLSQFLPVLYKELVVETQTVIEDGLNEEHRLLSMRARPKILVAHSFERAMELYEQFKPFVLGVISDVRFPKNGVLDGCAGIRLLRHIRQDRFDIPLLLTSSEPGNARQAEAIPACFVDKNAAALNEKIRSFLTEHLGFGNFVFRMPDGTAFDQATDLYSLEKKLAEIPIESFLFHCRHNDFSRWFYTLAEVELASQVRPLRDSSFATAEAHRQRLVQMIRAQRIERQRGVIVNFDPDHYEPDIEFAKIGNGSLGGKARGLAFFAATLYRNADLLAPYPLIEVFVPQTLIITTDAFDAFLRLNGLQSPALEDLTDEAIAERFRRTRFPETLRAQLAAFLDTARKPLAVRSSSLLEDARFKSYAGLYHTCMLANDHPDPAVRLDQLLDAVRMVYASTFFEAPRAFTRRVGNRIEQERMAVILQQVIGSRYGDTYYPAISGLAQSLNYYPFARMDSGEGVASIALGLGKTVMEGEKILRFSPRYPEILPQRASVGDILDNAQKHFYALRLGRPEALVDRHAGGALCRLEIAEAQGDFPVQFLTSCYIPEEQRIRDQSPGYGIPVLTFAAILKHRTHPLPPVIEALLALGRREMGCPVEIEFAVDFPGGAAQPARLAVLQIRPMSAREDMLEVEIGADELQQAFCVCHQSLGNTDNRNFLDLVFIRPDTFDPARTAEIARELAKINSTLVREERKYILIGPGRWGSADPWLGIPVTWADIAGVGAIIETTHPQVHADPSQGSHFFHNITSLGINYLSLGTHPADRLDWQWLAAQPVLQETAHAAHVRLARPCTLKVDGRRRIGIVYAMTADR